MVDDGRSGRVCRTWHGAGSLLAGCFVPAVLSLAMVTNRHFALRCFFVWLRRGLLGRLCSASHGVQSVFFQQRAFQPAQPAQKVRASLCCFSAPRLSMYTTTV